MRRYHDHLMEVLKDPEEAAAYLNAVLEDGHPKMFLIALRDVAEAQGGLLRLSKKTKMSRANLYKMLCKSGHPEVQSLYKVLLAFGLSLSVSVKSDKKQLRKAA